MKKAIACILIGIILACSLFTGAFADNSIYAVLLKALRREIPLDQSCQFGEDLNGRITIDYFFDNKKFEEEKILSYILHAQAVCRPDIDSKLVSYVHFRSYDEYTLKDVFSYETNGAKLGKIVDRRSGKKKTTKFENIIDVYLYCPQQIPEDAENGEELEIVQGFVEYTKENPKLKSKKLLTGYAKKLGVKTSEALEILQDAMYKVYIGE